jgi:HSP20 family molecular chaperone IbpA
MMNWYSKTYYYYDVFDNGNDTLTLNLATPGLRKEDLKLSMEGTTLQVQTVSSPVGGVTVIHKGIPEKFDYKFNITGYEVADAKCGDGILQVLLARVAKKGVIQIK